MDFSRDDVNGVDELFLQYEKINWMTRLDNTKTPTAFKCATVNSEELKLLKKVKNIIRKGRVQSLENEKIIFQDNRYITFNQSLYI